ncbi:MAG: hypothetical protein U0821_23710 [Chloroflexota bacterium]
MVRGDCSDHRKSGCGNDNGGGGCQNNGNDNGDCNHNGNDNGNDNKNHNGNKNKNDNGDNGTPAPAVIVQRPAAPAAPPAPSCSSPGSEMAFTSDDGRVSVRVFGSMPIGVKVRVRMPIDASSVPATPGTRVDGLLFQLLAEQCDGSGLATLPREVNLGVRYSDGDAGGLNEANFKVARLDQQDNKWNDVDKQAPDPGANYVSATITEMGFYVIYQK